ncbi:MAG: ABC transporter ATP-binding protein [Flavobacteriales bacterium]
MSTTSQLHIQNLAFSYAEKELFSNVHFSVSAGTIASIQGRNGTGKSTLLKCIAGLLQPNEGSITVGETHLNALQPLARSRYIGTLWTDRSRLPGFTLRELVHMGTFNAQQSSSTAERKATTEASLSALDLCSLADRPLHKLSDGELQKGMIARALAQQPAFLLLDEPTTYLDYIAKEELMQTLQHVCKSTHIGILFTSHDLEIIRSYATHPFELANCALRPL